MLFALEKKKSAWPRDFEALAQAAYLKAGFGKTKYDYFIDFESSPYSAVLSFFIKARRKIGHIIRRKRKFLYNVLYDTRVDHKDGEFYIIHRHLALIKALKDFTNTDNSLVLRLSETEKNYGLDFYVKNGIKQEDRKILMSLSSTWPTKAWPDEHWLRLAEMISSGMKGAKIILLWAPGDSSDLLKKMNKVHGTVAIPETTLRQMSSIMSAGDVLVANDGASRHIGAALGLKTIGLFGPTTEKGWAYADEKTVLLRAPRAECEPCHRADCRIRTGCMHKIRPQEVFENIKRMTGG
jgi:ADP-heptose:LPS heptosyltransferase